MAGVYTGKTWLRFVSLVTLWGFIPSSVGIWNLAPQVFLVAHAEVAKGESVPGSVTAESPAVPAVAPSTTGSLTPLTEDQLKTIAVKPPAPRVEPTLIARVSHHFQYDGSGDKTKDTQPGGSTLATYSYNTVGSVLTTATNLGETVSFAYTDGIHPVTLTGLSGQNTTLSYDASNRVTKVVTPSSGANGVQYTYNSAGQIISMTNPLGNSAIMGYDSLGRATSSKDLLNNETKYEYDDYGHATKETDPRNKVTYFYYASGGCACGATGQLTKVIDPLNNETTFAYDTNGNRTLATDALSHTLKYYYDAMGEVTTQEFPSGSGVCFTTCYDKQGQVTSKTDFDGKTTYFYYDFYGRMTRQSDPVGDYVQNSYDSLGNLTVVTDGGGNATSYYYDGDNRLTKTAYPGGKYTRNLYDSYGRMTKVGAGSDGSVDPTEYFYHGMTGLMTKSRYTSGGNTFDTNYSYNAENLLTKLTDWLDGTNGQIYAYSAAERLTKLTDYDGSHLDYTYDASGNILTMTTYHSSIFTYTYTDTNKVSTITSPGNRTWTYTYNALGQPTQVSIPNGMTTVYGYDSRNRITKVEHKDGATVDDGFTYALSSQGDITRTTYQDNAYWTYLYDGRHRLTKAERYDSASTLLKRWTYSYSAANNMTTKQVYTPPSTTDTCVYTYNTANELTKQTVAGTDTSFAYDAWGRQTSKSQAGYSAAYYYNYGGKLTKASSSFPGEGTVTYKVGGDGMRRERDDGAKTGYNRDANGLVVEEEDSNGALVKTFVNDSARIVGNVIADVSGSSPSSGTYQYYYQDYIGSTRRLRDQSKSSTGQYENEPYGADYTSSGASAARKYTGLDWDNATKLYSTPYREYSTELGRWLSRDPFGLTVDVNTYGYALSNPVSLVDPLGTQVSFPYPGEPPYPPATQPVPGNSITGTVCEAATRRIANNVQRMGYTGDDTPTARNNWTPDYDSNWMRHCIWQCLLTADQGEACAIIAGYAHEFLNQDNKLTLEGFSSYDLEANEVGRSYGASLARKKSGMLWDTTIEQAKYCERKCVGAFRLPVQYPATSPVWLTPGN